MSILRAYVPLMVLVLMCLALYVQLLGGLP